MKRITSVVIAGAFLLTSGIQAAAQDYSYRLAHVLGTAEPLHQASVYFAKLVNERSDGRIAIEVFPGGQLGTNIDLYEQVRLGAPVIQISDPGYLSDYVADFGILNGPYLLDDPADFANVVASDWYKEITEKLAQQNDMRVLSLGWLFGSRHIISNREIRTPADIESVTIRVPPNTMWIETFRAMGARGETLAWAEVYSGLASGVVEAAEAPLSSLLGARLYENANTVSMTGHFTAFIGPVMNEDLFRAMPEDLQAVMINAAADAGEYMIGLVNEGQTALMEDLRANGVTIVEDVDRQAFRKVTSSVYKQFPDWSEGLYETVNAILSE